MMRPHLLFGVIFWVGLATFASGSQRDLVDGDQEKTTTIQRIESDLVIDGELDEPEWELAEPFSDFIQRDPRTGASPSEVTEVRLLYNDEYLYVGVYCFDSEGEKGIVVTEMRRDFSPRESDTFTIALDTFDDDRNGVVFDVNARGARADMQVGDDGAKRNREWDGIWYAQTKITERGWQAEIAIPFKTLRFGNEEQQVWGINFQRKIRRKGETNMWSLVERPYLFNRMSRAGRLEGLAGIRPGRNLYVKPYISAPLTRRRDDDVDFLPEVGLDVKYGLGSQLALDLTVNTDFAQVEADDEQINLTRFSLFFPEKREFFLENATVFQFGPGTTGGFGRDFRDLIPFFSRRIGISRGNLVPILGGARLTGKVGQYTLGLLSLQVDKFEETPSTNFSVFRVRRNLLRRSEIGGLFINKQDTDGRFNRTFGADANFTFFDYLNISSFLVKTTTPEIPDKDMAGFFRIDWTDTFLTLQASHLSIQDNINPEVGFVPRKGIRKSAGEFAVRPRPRERIPSIREFEPLINLEYITDQDNVLETRTIEGRFTTTFRNGAEIWFSAESIFERLTEPFPIRSDQIIPVGDYSFHEYTLSLSSDQSRLFSGGFQVGTGSFFDGDKNSYEITASFRRPQLQAEISWEHDDVSLPTGDFETDLVAARLNYSFNPNMFLNALIQYNRDERETSSNIRFNFIHKPLSDFFLVYNEKRSPTGEMLEWALIAKLTYAFSF